MQHRASAVPRWRPQRTGLWLAMLLAGIAAWFVLWSVVRPRATYDTLWYATYAFEYAGDPQPIAVQRAGMVFAQYADPTVVERARWPAAALTDPSRARWAGIYRMRPVMPLIAGVAEPWLGSNALLFPSLIAVVLCTLAIGLVLPPLAGWFVTLLTLALLAINPQFAMWLIFLTTDGLAIGLWTLAVLAMERYVATGGRWWLAIGTASALVLAFTRQTGVALPVAFGVATLVCWIVRRGPLRRLLMSAIASTLPLLVFGVFVAVARLPSVVDMLQDLPTVHFSRPDLSTSELVRYLVRMNLQQLPAMAGTMLAAWPIAVAVAGGVAGLVMEAKTWTWVMLGTLPGILLLQVLHPSITQAERTLAPAWVVLSIGLALLARSALQRTGIGWPRRAVLSSVAPERAVGT